MQAQGVLYTVPFLQDYVPPLNAEPVGTVFWNFIVLMCPFPHAYLSRSSEAYCFLAVRIIGIESFP